MRRNGKARAANTPQQIKHDSHTLPLARTKWQSSGLSEEQAIKLRFQALSAEQTAALGPSFLACRSMKIPYFTLSGTPTDFFRVRYLGELPGFAGVVEKPQRYAQPAGTLNEVYFPPILDKTWEEVTNDTSVPIHITEGELKAAAGCSVGLVTMGLGGVDVWRSSKREIEFLPSLDRIKWHNREVVIVYDSDAATNPNVVRAQLQLARELIQRGALPSVASIPPGPNGRKRGLDDLLMAEGAAALTAIVQAAPSFPEAEALWGMNEEVVYILDPGIIVIRGSGQQLEPGRFVSHAYANRHYTHTEINRDGRTIFKKKKLAQRWIEWEHRHEMRHITYAPGKPQIIDGKWNTWGGWGVNPAKGDISPWHWLLDYLFKGFPENREWIERWFAYPLQHPGTKLYSAPLVWGRETGTGKTAMFYAIMAIYGKNAIEIKNKHLRGGFNAWQERRQFVYGDEIEGNDAGAKRIDSEWVKGLITQKEVTINQKFLPEYTIPDVINYGFTSQHPDALFLDDKDRRFFIHEVVGGPAQREFYERFNSWLHGNGPAALFDHLLRLPLKDFNPRERAPMTLAKQQMILNSKSDVAYWCVRLKEDPVTTLAPLGQKAAKECDLFLVSQLMTVYDPERKGKVSLGGLARELQKAGIRQANAGVTMRTVYGITRLYIIRNHDKWSRASVKQLQDHFNSFFGTGGKFS